MEIVNQVKKALNIEQLRLQFSKHRELLRPLDTHQIQFTSNFGRIKDNYDSMSQWFFEDDRYTRWQAQNPAADDISMLCVIGPPGFGKSSIMTSAIKRLHDLLEEAWRDDSAAIVLFYFFKKGDETTQTTTRCLESLAAQLLREELIRDEEQLQFVVTQLDVLRAASTKATSAINSPELLMNVIKLLRKTIGRRLFVVIDAMDECEDRLSEKILGRLMELSRTIEADPATKVILTTRSILNKETTMFAPQNEEEKLPEATGQQYDDANDKHTITTKGSHAIIFKVDKTQNTSDMERYLSMKIRTLMLRNVKRKPDASFDRELARIVKDIRTKANGMFTYAAMTIASLEQPYSCSLAEKLRQLPDGMNGLYKSSLEALNTEEKKLVLIALRRVIWRTGPVLTTEIAEEFKKTYESHIVANEEIVGVDDGEGEKNEDEKSEDENSDHPENYDPAADPEIADTIAHLKRAGRDFFRFGEDSYLIDVIHNTVRDWVEKEAKLIDERSNKMIPVSSMYSLDTNGQWTFSMPVPSKDISVQQR